MELIPLIHIKSRKIFPGKNDKIISFNELLDQITGEKKIYIFDFDGIEKDKPNLCTFQRLAGQIDFWVDSGPRDQGDVVDATLSGATDITLRRKISPQIQVESIKEITENKIYESVDFAQDFTFEKTDGFVNFYRRKEIENNFKFSEFLKNKSLTSSIYTYESDVKNIPYWKKLNVKGLLVDLDKLEEFKNAL